MKLTVFTPTYNRAYSLPRLFLSLQTQSVKDFEWLICDDGSTDNTEEVVKKLMSEADGFIIKYIKQNHGGKHRAQNNAIHLAEGEYFLTCDSNKYLAQDAVEEILRQFDTISDTEEMCGVGGYRADFKGNVYGGPMKLREEHVDCTNLEREKYGLCGDKASAFYTHVLKEYPFPEFEGEMFVSESAWLTPMAMDGYRIRWFPKILIYGEYTEDGLTKQGANEYRGHFDNFHGHLHVLSMELSAYGIKPRIPDLYEALDIAKEKGMDAEEFCNRLKISMVQLCGLKIRRFLGKMKRRYIYR